MRVANIELKESVKKEFTCYRCQGVKQNAHRKGLVFLWHTTGSDTLKVCKSCAINELHRPSKRDSKRKLQPKQYFIDELVELVTSTPK